MNAITDVVRAGREIRDHIALLRKKITDLQSQRDKVLNDPLPRDDVKKILTQWLQQQADRTDPGVVLNSFLHGNADNNNPLPLLQMTSKVNNFRTADNQLHAVDATADLAPLLSFLFGDLILKRFEELLDEHDYSAGEPLARRHDAVRDLDLEIDGLERAEEMAICDAHEVGINIDRREDARAEIILEAQ